MDIILLTFQKEIDKKTEKAWINKQKLQYLFFFAIHINDAACALINK